MSSAYESRSHSQRDAKDAIGGTYFPVYVCARCDEEFCLEPGCGTEKRVCPACGSDDTSESVHRVYA